MTVSSENKFEELYVLASDRDEKEKVLKTLIPGSPHYYYYNVLHVLNSDPSLSEQTNKDKFAQLMKAWIGDIKNAPDQRYQELDLRQKILSFTESNIKPSPLSSTIDMFEELKNIFYLHFSYSQTHSQSLETSDQDSSNDHISNTLDKNLVDRKKIVNDLISRIPHSKYIADYINPNTFDYILNNFSNLPAELEQSIISKLKYPVNGDKIIGMLESKIAQYPTFGSLNIHNNLTLEQMDKIIEKFPSYVDHTYIKLYLEKLLPNYDLHDWETLKAGQEEFYQSATKFVNTLPSTFNSYKLLIYYHFIKFQLTQNIYDKASINKYFSLPRDTHYYTSVDRTDSKITSQLIRFNESFSSNLKGVSQDDDEKLISFLLKKLFIEESTIKPYSDWFKPSYLESLLAESKLVSMKDQPEKWIQMIDNHSKVQTIRDRVDIEFLPNNKSYYHPDDEVSLECSIKNVPNLLVKVFEISTFNYYKSELKQIDSNINLDGLIASEELQFEYPDCLPIQKVERKYDFPTLKGKRGVFVIEFIGNGKSSRAMIYKGDLHFITEVTPTCQLIKVLDEDSVKVLKCSVYIDGNTYNSNDDGDIKIPFSSTTSNKDLIIIAQEFATLKNFKHQAETYQLVGGIFVENGSLLQGEKAPIVVRAKLFLGDTQISNKYLEETSLTIFSTDNSSSPITNSKEVKPFTVQDNQESVYIYRVQENLQTLVVRFQAKVRNLSKNNSSQDVSFEKTFTVNQIHGKEISEFYLQNTKEEGYRLQHLGKGGEPLSNLSFSFEFTHWVSTNERVNVQLKTDKDGFIHLGHLDDVKSFIIYGSRTFEFTISKAQNFTYPSKINCKLGDKVTLPYLGTEKSPSRAELNLFELNGRNGQNVVIHDCFKSLSIEKDEIVLSQLSAGRYVLIVSGSIQSNDTQEIIIDVCDGQIKEGYIVGPSRILSYRPTNGLHFETSVDKQHLLINLKNYTADTRVHVISTYFTPNQDMADLLSLKNSSMTYDEYSVKPKSQYFNGRSLGDEISYIINRKSSKKQLPGNSLKKPSILVQPWAISKTTQSNNSLNSSSSYGMAERESRRARDTHSQLKKVSTHIPKSPFLEFLGYPTIVINNLLPNDKGQISVELSQLLEAGSSVQIVAVDNESVFSKDVLLEQHQAKFKETKLIRSLDPNLHYKEEKLITPVCPNQTFTINNVDSSKYTTYDTLDKVLSLMKTINSSHLQDFSFISEWESLSFDKKKEKFSKYTCHELNFFIYKKDKEFFNQVVLPFVQTKGYKTFIDYYLVKDKKKLEIYILDSFRFNKLNSLEKILLGELFPEHSSVIANSFKQKVEVSPITPAQYDKNFKVALNQLDTDIEGGSGEEERGDDDGGMDEPQAMLADIRGDYKQKKNMVSEKAAPMMFGAATTCSMPAPPPPSFAVNSMAAPAPAPAGMMRMAARAPASILPHPAPITRAYEAPQMYQQIEKTQELAETNYYKELNLRSSLIPINNFWYDYASYVAEKKDNTPFVSKYIAFTCSSFAESMMALSVLDLPFTVKDNTTQVRPKDGKLIMKPSTPIIVFHQELVSGEIAKKSQDILITQHFFDPNDQFTYKDGETEEVYITDQFLVSKVYSATVIVANLSSKQKKLDVLLQIPKGAIAVGESPFVTRDFSIDLLPYSNNRLEYSFYFPAPGSYVHFPAHISEKQNIIASVTPFVFDVVLKKTIINQMSWEYIANHGTLDSILEYLEKENLHRVEFHHLYHRFTDKKIWIKVIELLKRLKFYDSTTWSFSIYHKDSNYIKDFLSEHSNDLRSSSIDAPLVYVNPFENNVKFLEYSPLVNSRTHKIGEERKILNNKLSNQYYQFLKVLSYKLHPTDTELLSLAYYLLLQDRFEESINIMKRVGVHDSANPKILENLSSDNNNIINNTGATQTKSEPTSALSSEEKKKKEKEDKQREKEEKQKEKEREKERKQKEKEDKKREKEEAKRKEKEEKKKKEEEKKLKKKGGSEPTSPSVESTTTDNTTSSETQQTTSTTTTTTTSDVADIKPISEHHHDDSDHEDDEEEYVDVSEFNHPLCLPEMSIQYDYLISYLDFFNSNPKVASENSKKYENYPVQRWNSLFKDLKNKVDQVSNKDSIEIDYENEIDRERRLNKMSSNEPTFDLSQEADRTISVSYHNLKDITVSYYVMDIEHLFSTNPFVQQKLGQFLYVTPNKKESFLLKDKSGSFQFKIPEEFNNSNVVVNVVASQVHHNINVFSNNLSVYITEKTGQLRVVQKQNKKPVSKAYIKVYSKTKNDKVEFWKDGYTDIAGYFDYATVSSSDISDVSKLSILILSNQNGAIIKETKPPAH
ncbi:hypothetical protein DICPUDRAFT_77330 [Dictyostelium purpureum]|uniref:Chromatin assembly factor 1 p150 subunit acidic region domain-containing protein n=1 Tax=Dictyostelium purpureum TaxID=5786 RepID=F0ZGA5_DICPU|nr:uncharacterized protein DICPUDRAFT_77330 [Dictyostelium purpureum]EGC37010.1 hypothetical protein DICPUDRAFT_77330 [Dictyostelium purpureum]|eukprot:XP_003286438.1 hypothetical protein DICPUDRAFT_77330 [Dictyostelium purpureum]